MKKLYWTWLVFCIGVWILYLGVQILESETRGHDFDLLGASIRGIFMVICCSLGGLLGIYSIFPRMKYLENDNVAKPSFKVFGSFVIDMPQRINFSLLKSEIAAKWLITFSDDTNQVLKFRTRTKHLFLTNTFGAAAWLKFDSDAGKIQLVCFPMIGIQDNDLARKMYKEIVKCLKHFEQS